MTTDRERKEVRAVYIRDYHTRADDLEMTVDPCMTDIPPLTVLAFNHASYDIPG